LISSIKQNWTVKLVEPRTNFFTIKLLCACYSNMTDIPISSYFCLFRKFQIDSQQFEKIFHYIRSGVESNATLECGGDRIGTKGFFVQPTVFSNVQVIMPSWFFKISWYFEAIFEISWRQTQTNQNGIVKM
jgi:hypothetical protein